VSPLPPVEPAPEKTSTSAPLKATAKSVSSVSGASKSPAPADSANDLGEQLRLIDAARSAIAAGNAGAASQALSSYSAKFPHGSFGQEAAVLRIETLDLQGNHAQAAALARNFLAQHPNSPHVGLVQRIANRGQ
jgi:outer membrane protein assembly factor BamD (BamD/ComL family)